MNVSSGAQAVKVATQWLGTPYRYGGGHSGPVKVGTPVDCSGLVDQVFGIQGNTFTQVRMGTAVANLSDAKPGDLVFFGPLAPGEPHHVGIYTGGGMMIDAPHTGTTVRIDRVSGFGPINAIRRLVATGSNGSTGTSTGVVYDYAQLEGVWIQAGGSQQYANMAAAIAMAESGGNANASHTNGNGSVDRGLWQINSSNGSGSTFDVMTNARTAVQMSNRGTNWKPWCTAYSDGACGSQGGTYLGPGAPYQRFFQVGIAPDFSAPINATNAAGAVNNPNVILTSYETTSASTPGQWDCLFNPLVKSEDCDPITRTIKLVLKAVLAPAIQVIAGALGVTAGVIMMIVGFYLVLTNTRSGRQAAQGTGQAVRLGAQVVAPESRLAGARTATYERELPGGQTRVTTVTGQRRFGRYRQKSTTNVYGTRTAERPPGAPVYGGTTYAPPGARPQGSPPDTRQLLRGEASSYTRPPASGRRR